MGLVKTRRLAAMHPPSLKLPPSPRLQWTSRRINGRDEAADEGRWREGCSAAVRASA